MFDSKLHNKIMSGQATRRELIQGIHNQLDRRRDQKATGIENPATYRGCMHCTDPAHRHGPECFGPVHQLDR